MFDYLLCWSRGDLEIFYKIMRELEIEELKKLRLNNEAMERALFGE